MYALKTSKICKQICKKILYYVLKKKNDHHNYKIYSYYVKKYNLNISKLLLKNMYKLLQLLLKNKCKINNEK